MSRTITALFNTRADAEAGRQRLLATNIDADNVKIHDKASLGETAYSSHSAPGMWASIKNAFLPDEDRHTYEEGVRRGGFLLTADVDDDEADEAVKALNEAHMNSVDIDERASQWKSQGWNPPAAGLGMAGAAGMSTGFQKSSSMSAQSANQQASIGRTGSLQRDTATQSIPVVEEQLKIGKREVQQGGVRVYSRIVETPVNESISLREEHVDVQRRAVDQPISSDDVDAFREQSIEMRETAEEAVVQKSARVVEELTVSKQVNERQEQVHDTVRRTEVEVERLDGMTASGGTNDDSYYRSHFQSNYGASGGSYDDYAPAYTYGSQMRGDSRYSSRQWDDVESDLRSDWESRNAGGGSTWEKMKSAVRHGWDRMTNDTGTKRSY
ncbi:YsnF/AvaK domain-containing protein [Massilia sp. DD77]|uniref:YsnF/AvaK domain-containing protein n=1 Tax=Massilia sp. DD77 TaxID=3109349 RepID=UPI0030003AAA